MSTKEMVGTPGTAGSLALRVGQLLFAVSALVFMVADPQFTNFTSFCYLVAAMGMQCLWSLAMVLFDFYSLLRPRGGVRMLNGVCLFAICDWVFATLSLAAACATAGVVLVFEKNFHWCLKGICSKYEVSISLTFLSWILTQISFLLTFWVSAMG